VKRDTLFADNAGRLVVCARIMADAFGAGHKLFSFGGGESAPDAPLFSVTLASQLQVVGRPGDVALGRSTDGAASSVHHGLAAARDVGMATIGMTGAECGPMVALCDHCFVVPSGDPLCIQETHDELLRALWDLVQQLRGEEGPSGR
jgi:phosphoheptose isomerase